MKLSKSSLTSKNL